MGGGGGLIPSGHTADEACNRRHYQCFLDPAHLEEARWTHGSLAGSWHWSSAPDHILPSVWVDEEGGCADEMDATLWQLILNLICNRR